MPRFRKPVVPLTEAQQEMAVAYLPFALWLARRALKRCRCDPDQYLSAAQLGLVKAVRTFRPEGGLSITNWIKRLVNQEFRISHRAQRPLNFRDKPDHPQTVGESFATFACRHVDPKSRVDGLEQLDQLLITVPPETRPIFELIHRQGLTAADTARALGLSVPTIRARYFQAMTELRRLHNP